jgi:MHS family proline/betaine transporter-like MFS transporter
MEASDLRTGRTKILVAAALGNAFEWFDFVIYGYLALTMSKLFFPQSDANLALMLTWATFAVGFIMRPIGALVLGVYADRVGRRSALSLTIWIMAVATAMIGFSPTYESIGRAAAIFILLARLLQGFAASGEYGSAVALLAESAPTNQRAFYVAWQMASTLLAIVVAGMIGVIGTQVLSTQQLTDWGWRVPFLLGLLIAPIGYFIRTRIDETLDRSRVEATSWNSNMKRLLRTHLREVVAAFALMAMGAGNFYITFIYMPTFAVKELGLGSYAPFVSTTTAGVICAVGALRSAVWVDRGGSARMLLGVAAVTLGVIAYPLYSWLILVPTMTTLMIVQILLAIPGSVIVGLVSVICAGLFPTHVRASMIGLSYNVTNSVFGGLAPLAVTYAVATTNDKSAAAYYIVAMAVVGLAGLFMLNGKATPLAIVGMESE